MADYNLEKLFDDLLKKKKFDKENSYTSTLLTNKNLLAKKLGEESIETCVNPNEVSKITLKNIFNNIIFIKSL